VTAVLGYGVGAVALGGLFVLGSFYGGGVGGDLSTPAYEAGLAVDHFALARQRTKTKAATEEFAANYCRQVPEGFQAWQWSRIEDGRRVTTIVSDIASNPFDTTQDRVEWGFTRVDSRGRPFQGQTGTGTTPAARTWVQSFGDYRAGHVISDAFGGAGRLGNIVPQTDRSNSQQRDFERHVSNEFNAIAGDDCAKCFYNFLTYLGGPVASYTYSSNSQVPSFGLVGFVIVDGQGDVWDHGAEYIDNVF
jgi:hypothetical protein